MQELQIINQQEVLGKDFKIYGDFENPLFLAKDVAEWIEYGVSNVSKMVKNVDDDEKITTRTNNTSAIFLTENGLYEVLMQSRKPIAKEFKKQVKVILKSIRKHGGYISNQEQMSNEELLSKALLFANNVIAEKDKLNKELQASNSKLLVDNTIMQPKAEYFDELVDRKLLTGIRETAKELKIPPKKFVSFLLSKKYLFRNKKGNLEPYAQHVKNGLFETKEQFNEKTNWSGTQVFITPKGRETFRLLYVEVE